VLTVGLLRVLLSAQATIVSAAEASPTTRPNRHTVTKVSLMQECSKLWHARSGAGCIATRFKCHLKFAACRFSSAHRLASLLSYLGVERDES
jgi:hypothetical protein